MTGPYVTLAERKAEQDRATAEAVRSLEEILAAFAGEHGGRYILFGSAAAGQMGHHSDVDLIVDFPPEHRSAAIRFAEEEIWKRRLLPDVRAVDYCSDALAPPGPETGQDLGMTDARWRDAFADVAHAGNHFSRAVQRFSDFPVGNPDAEYEAAMALCT